MSETLIPAYELNNAIDTLHLMTDAERRKALASLIIKSYEALPSNNQSLIDAKRIEMVKDRYLMDKPSLLSKILKPRQVKEKPTKFLSSYEDETYLYEQVYDPSILRSSYARYNLKTREVDYVAEIEREEDILKPITDEEVTKGAVLLPNKAEPYSNEDELDQQIVDFINQWLDIPENIQRFGLWNIKRSWVYQKFHSINYLRALGDTGLGKTRFLDTLGGLHYKPIFASGATTSAPLFRVIDKWRGTLILDEADLKDSDESSDIIKIINMGYEKGKFVMRCDQNDATKVQFFDPFCPKVMATRFSFKDKATESRCVTQVMTGTTRQDIPVTLTKRFHAESQTLRNKLLTWRFNNYPLIDEEKTSSTSFGELEPRVRQIVSSYLALFGHDEAKMLDFKTFIEEYQEALIEERADTYEGQIVKAIYDLFNQGELNISSQDIIAKADLTDRDGKALKPRAITKYLKALGFGKAEHRHTKDLDKRCIPLEQPHLGSVFKRYGCDTVTDVTIHTDSIKTKNNSNLDSKVVDVTDGEALHSNRPDCHSVTKDDEPKVSWEEVKDE